MATHLSYTEASANRKLGPIPCTYVEKDTCWRGCALWEICYAFWGFVGMQWTQVTAHARGMPWPEFITKLRRLPRWVPWRYAVAGDLPGKGPRINPGEFKQLVHANNGRMGWTYTHKPLGPTNVKLIKYALERGFTINISANNLQHADEIADAHPTFPIATLMPDSDSTHCKTPAGRAVVQCPAQYLESFTCSNCLLCAMPKRYPMVGFKPEGTVTSQRHVRKLLEGTTTND